MPVKILVAEAIWNEVSGPTFASDSRSARPYVAIFSTLPSRTMAVATPGTWFFSMTAWR